MLEQFVKEGKFRADLFYRLNVIPIVVPSLRERAKDIPDFVEAAMTKFTRQTAKRIKPEVVKILAQYPWPGNVRELFNVIERMVNLSDGDEIGLCDLPMGILDRKKRFGENKTRLLQKVLEEAEQEAIIQMLRETNGNITIAAKILGIHRVTLQ